MSADTGADETFLQQNNKIHGKQEKEFDQMATDAITKEIRLGFKDVNASMNTMNNNLNTMNNNLNSRLTEIKEMMEKEQVCCSIL
jgi:Mg2+ and Co2+ transporter CorA